MEQTPLAAIWRFRWLVLLFTLLGGTIALLLAIGLLPPRYEATASLVVTDPRATTLFSASEAAGLDAERYVADQKAILGSDIVAQRASELVAAALPGSADTPRQIAKNVKISTSSSNEIVVSYPAEDEQTAIATANAIIEAYELLRGESAGRDSASAIGQLDQSINDIDAELADIQEQIIGAREDPVWIELNLQYQAALNRLAQVQPRLTTARGDALVALQAEVIEIDEQLNRLSGIIQIEEADPRLIQLKQQQAEATARRRVLAEERDRLLIDTELLSGGITLSSPAQFAEAVRTDVAMTFLGVALGLLAGAGLAYLLAMRRRKFDDRAQPGWVLRAELLAEVPNFREEGVDSEIPVVDHPASVTAEAFRFAATTLDLQITEHQYDGQSDAAPVHTFLITSASPGDGKTVLVANLALAAARKGRSVLVIDADFGYQRLTELLRGESSDGPGITEVVEAGLDLDSAIIQLPHPGSLDLLSRGQRKVTAPDFFSLPAAKAFIAKVGQFYDLVLIDGPPMLHIAYASSLATYVDRVVAVVQHGSGIKQLEDLSQRLDLIGTPLAGYVYNAAPLRYEMTLTEGSLKDVLGHDLGVGEAATRKRRKK
jgi:Mrp family chromosome partitioning ATPase